MIIWCDGENLNVKIIYELRNDVLVAKVDPQSKWGDEFYIYHDGEWEYTDASTEQEAYLEAMGWV